MSDLVRVPAGEFQKNVGHYGDIARSRPVIVTHNGRDRNVYLSNEEYQRLKRRDRDVLGLDDFTESDLDALRRAKPARGAARFNPEVK